VHPPSYTSLLKGAGEWGAGLATPLFLPPSPLPTSTLVVPTFALNESTQPMGTGRLKLTSPSATASQ